MRTYGGPRAGGGFLMSEAALYMTGVECTGKQGYTPPYAPTVGLVPGIAERLESRDSNPDAVSKVQWY